jgi:cytochrome o ubiquinol oxidase subunit 2
MRSLSKTFFGAIVLEKHEGFGYVAKSKRLNKRFKWAAIALMAVWLLVLLAVYLHNADFAVLNPAGEVATRERQLMILTIVLAMFVIIPVYVMTAVIAWRYRESNHKARYEPDLSSNLVAETVWWGIPTAIILVLSIVTWNTSHSLDPNKALASSAKPLQVQVVALDWKWLFIYPEWNVATVNELAMPVGAPVQFTITADAPMNSFWIPRLGSQIYAMPGMATHLNLVADKPGVYKGSSANISGRGFAGMDFDAKAVSDDQFSDWVGIAKQSSVRLDAGTYQQLAKPSVNQPVTYYSSVDRGLFEKVVNKYMTPGASDVR